MASLSDTDAKILKILLADGRKPFVEIANELGISKDIVWRNYAKMKTTGIITGATTQVHSRKVGYYGVASVHLNVESRGTQDLLKNANAIYPDFHIFRQFSGRFNVGAIIRFRELRELDQIKEVICRNRPVNEIRTYIWTDVRNIPENIVPNCSYVPEIEKQKTANLRSEGSVDLCDTLDLQIIEALAANGRASFREIGSNIGISADTVARRYEILKKSNALRVTIQVNPKKLGYQAILDTSIALTTQDETIDIVNRLAQIQGVGYILRITGDYDLQVVTLVRDCEDIIRINLEIEDIPHIKRIEALMRQFRSGRESWPGGRQHISTF